MLSVAVSAQTSQTTVIIGGLMDNEGLQNYGNSFTPLTISSTVMLRCVSVALSAQTSQTIAVFIDGL